VEPLLGSFIAAIAALLDATLFTAHRETDLAVYGHVVRGVDDNVLLASRPGTNSGNESSPAPRQLQVFGCSNMSGLDCAGPLRIAPSAT